MYAVLYYSEFGFDMRVFVGGGVFRCPSGLSCNAWLQYINYHEIPPKFPLCGNITGFLMYLHVQWFADGGTSVFFEGVFVKLFILGGFPNHLVICLHWPQISHPYVHIGIIAVSKRCGATRSRCNIWLSYFAKDTFFNSILYFWLWTLLLQNSITYLYKYVALNSSQRLIFKVK